MNEKSTLKQLLKNFENIDVECPECNATIKMTVKKCRYCGFKLELVWGGAHYILGQIAGIIVGLISWITMGQFISNSSSSNDIVYISFIALLIYMIVTMSYIMNKRLLIRYFEKRKKRGELVIINDNNITNLG